MVEGPPSTVSATSAANLALHITHAVPVDEQRVDVLVATELLHLVERDAVLLSRLGRHW